MGLYPKEPVEDGDYLLRRAVAETEQADRAAPGAPTAVHRTLASAYLDRLFGENAEQARGAKVVRERRRVLMSTVGTALSEAPANLRGAGITDLFIALQRLD